jgi:hypothetical protein
VGLRVGWCAVGDREEGCSIECGHCFRF